MRLRLFLLAHLLAVCTAQALAADIPWQRFEESRALMGTKFEIKLYAPDATTKALAFQAAFQKIESINAIMSDYDSQSELLKLCKLAPTTAPVAVSPELARVLRAAQDMSRQTDGAFDVTVGNLTRLWRRARRQHEIPDPAQVAAALSTVGYRNLVVDPGHDTVDLKKPGMRIDLGAIAKGFAADEVIATLRELGIRQVLVDAGGEVVVGEPPPNAPGWRAGIAPLDPTATPEHFLSLANAAVATSGDAWQAIEVNGQRYSHILDPRTGYGLKVRSSVSVVAPTGMQADALATAVSVLGVEKGLALIEATPHAAALIVRLENGKTKTYQSRRLPDYAQQRSRTR